MNSDEEKIMRHAQFLGEDATDYVAGAPHMSPVDVLMSRAHYYIYKVLEEEWPSQEEFVSTDPGVYAESLRWLETHRPWNPTDTQYMEAWVTLRGRRQSAARVIMYQLAQEINNGGFTIYGEPPFKDGKKNA